MRRDFRAVVDGIIHPRFTRIRYKMRKALERAYEDGLNDSAAEIEILAKEAADRIRALNHTPPPLPLPEVIRAVRSSLQ
jgi:hypothetical protein